MLVKLGTWVRRSGTRDPHSCTPTADSRTTVQGAANAFPRGRPIRRVGGPTAYRGGPAVILRRRSSGRFGVSHGDSIHHVPPASANGRTSAAAAVGSSAGVTPSTMISNGTGAVRWAAT